MSALTASRNTPEWNGAPRYHYGLLPVEASTSIYVGGMVAIDASGNAVPAQSVGASPLNSLIIAGICEYVYGGGILPPGLNALNQSGNGALYPGVTATLGNAGALSVGVAVSIFGMDVDSTISAANIGEMVVANDDHTVSLGTHVVNTTSITVPSTGFQAVVLKGKNIARGTFAAYSATGGGGTQYVEGTDFTVDYSSGIFYALAAGALSGGGTVYTTYYYAGAKSVAGKLVAIDAGLAYVSFF
jgi:hypothetical protein